MRVAVVDGTARSPIRTSESASTCLTVAISAGEISNSFFASSVTNFTLRSVPTTMAGTPAAMSTSATEVMAGDADSMGNGRMGALGNGSSAGAVASRAWAGEELMEGAAGGAFTSAFVAGATEGAGGVTGFTFSAGLPFERGLSHFSQRIPRVIAVPHMKHFEAILGASRTADVTRLGPVRQRDIAYRPHQGRITSGWKRSLS